MNKKQFYIYSHSSVPWQQKILKDFLKKIPITKDSKCLDAGCGIGNNLKTLQESFKHIIACDISTKAIIHAKKRTKSVRFIETDITRLPFPDNYFDLVVCTEVIEHVKNAEGLGKELIRVLKNDKGYIIISCPNYFNLAGIIKLIIDFVSREKSWDVWGTNKYGKEDFTTFITIKKILRKNKITILKECGGDYLNSWLLFIPFIFRNYKLTDKHPFLALGKIPLLKKLCMNYFILAKTNKPLKKDLYFH
jgi:ubiquinone/menaquinone biosynthesis C-methylase UbiE